MTDLHRFADIHNHVRRAPDTVTSVEPSDELTGLPGEAWYSVGIHPWSTTAPIAEATWARLAAMAADPRTVAVGEAGLDTLRGGPAEVQEAVFERQAVLAEAVGKPLIIHCVRAFHRILALHRRLRPKQLWIVHGFRGSAALARQLTASGIALSVDARQRSRLPEDIAGEMIFPETDATAADDV